MCSKNPSSVAALALLTPNRRGMAAFMGKDVKKLKAKGGGKWKYMSETDMLKHSEKFAPYRFVNDQMHQR